MKKILPLAAFVIGTYILSGQSLYFPPAGSTTWDTISPSDLGWCQPNIDSLYNFLQSKNTDAFIVLKDGKMVIEKYFGTFTVDSIHDWYSASKSLTSMLTGIALQNNIINLDSPATHYLGVGWTSETPQQEDSITLLNLISMTSGTSPAPTGNCTNTDTTAACLQYEVPAGAQWAYHTGAYRKEETVLTNASGRSYDALSQIYLGSVTGMTGLWYSQEFISTTRSAARFGLLALNKGVWNGDTLLRDTAYYNAMIHTSQNYNLSYGYLWWLNGQASYMLPQSQVVYTGELVPSAPPDMFCALGKYDQKIYVVPSANMVIVRMGGSADSVADASSAFDNEVWGKLDSLTCSPAPLAVNNVSPAHQINIHPNPVSDMVYFDMNISNSYKTIYIYNMLGQLVAEHPYSAKLNLTSLIADMYIVRITDVDDNVVVTAKMVKQ